MNYKFSVRNCDATQSCFDGPVVADSGWVGSPRWRVPKGALYWGAAYQWTVSVRDNPYAGTFGPFQTFGTSVPVPAQTNIGLGQQASLLDGVSLADSHYERSDSDAEVVTAGPPLKMDRFYSSSNISVGAFGVGWSSVFDMKIKSTDYGQMVRLADGREVAFGLNPDNSYSPAPGSAGMKLEKCASCSNFTFTDIAGTASELSSTGIQKITNVDGRSITFTRTSAGAIVGLTDSLSGRTIGVAWNGGRISKVITRTSAVSSTGSLGADSNVYWTYQYSSNALTKACRVSSSPVETSCRTYSYTSGSPSQLLSRVVSGSGAVEASVAYMAGTSQVTSVNTGGGDTSFRRAWPDTKVLVTSPAGVTSIYDLDEAGRTTRLLDENNGSHRWIYDEQGQLAEYINAAGAKLKLSYEKKVVGSRNISTGRLSSRTWGDNSGTRWEYYTYDSTNGRLSSIGPRYGEKKQKFSYDQNSRIVSSSMVLSDTEAATTTYSYATGSELAFGSSTATVPKGVLLTTTDPVGAKTTYSYDGNGQVREVTNPVGLRTRYQYDSLGRISSTEVYANDLPTSALTTYSYAPNGSIASVENPTVKDSITSAERKLTQKYTFDLGGNVTSRTETDLVSGKSRSTAYVYDSLGRLKAIKSGAGVQLGAFEYDSFGNVTKKTDAAGTSTLIEYSKSNLPLKVSLVNYKDQAKPTVAATAIVMEERTFDSSGRVKEFKDANGQRYSFEYNYDGNVIKTVALQVAGDGGRLIDQTIEEVGYLEGNVTNIRRDGGLQKIFTTYDALDRPQASSITVKNADGSETTRRTDFTYNLRGQITSETVMAANAALRSTSYTYDAAGQVTSESMNGASAGDPKSTTTFRRSQRGLITAAIDPRWVSGSEAVWSTSYVYDEMGQLKTASAPPAADGSRATTSFSYDEFGRQAGLKDALGGMTRLERDLFDRVTEIEAPSANVGATAETAVTRMAYDVLGRVVTEVAPSGRTTTYGYDSLNRRTLVSLPSLSPAGSDRRWLTQYDRIGNVTETTDPTGARVTYAYDSKNRPTTATQILRQSGSGEQLTTSYKYDALGLRTTTTDPQGGQAVVEKNGFGEIVRSVDADSVSLDFDFDPAGNVQRVEDSSGAYTNYAYDPRNNVIGLTVGKSGETAKRSWAWSYDLSDNQISQTDARGYQKKFEFDKVNNFRSMTHEDGSVSKITYDLLGRPVTFTDPAGATSVSSYSPAGTLVSLTEPSTAAYPASSDRSTTWTYNGSGLPVKETSPGGVQRLLEYDVDNNLKAETGTIGQTTSTRSFSYDVVGRLNGFSHPNGTQSLTWDDLGRVTASNGPAGNVTRTFDRAGNVSKQTDATGTTTYAYSAGGRPTTVTSSTSANPVTITYDAAGRQQTESWGQATKRDFEYNSFGELSLDQLENASGAIQASFAYEYDQSGNRTKKSVGPTTVAGSGDQTYSYDARNRLTGWSDSAGVNHAISWNFDNDATNIDGTARTFDARNRLLRDGATSYTYSADGRTTGQSTPSSTFTYDGFGQLVNDGKSTYSYDALGRMSSAAGSSVSYAATDRDPLKIGSTSIVGGETAPILINGKYSVSDPHGDRVLDLASNGDLASRSYSPFGAILETRGGVDTTVAFQGDYMSSGGLINMDARWFNSASETFLSRDSTSLTADEQNRYGYGLANPVNMVDESGNCATPITAPACALGGVGSLAGPVSGAMGALLGLGLGVTSVLLYNQGLESMGGQSTRTNSTTLELSGGGVFSTPYSATDWVPHIDVQIGAFGGYAGAGSYGYAGTNVYSDISTSMGNLDASMTRLSNSMTHLSATMTQLNASMVALSSSLAGLDVALGNLSSSLANLEQTLARIPGASNSWYTAPPQEFVRTDVAPIGVAVGGPQAACAAGGSRAGCTAAVGTAGGSCVAAGTPLTKACGPLAASAASAYSSERVESVAVTDAATATKKNADCNGDRVVTTRGCEPLIDILQRNVTQARAEMATDPALRDRWLTDNERSAEATRPWLGPVNNGKAIERYVASKKEVMLYFEYIGGAHMPDFVAYKNIKGYEVTTDNEKTVARHLKRWYVGPDRIATYRQWRYGS
ncbi:RHS repeat-associated core domain-containing protein [Rathayibacter sp. AY1E8]|uniref:RHS repeat-associated core domain-containing protein n=1 Tax=Rathayibacter sp. AY1E8 TaxID=2080555 RepID=UPI0015E42A96|nr:RHS repeat-associated core domain-containing protein [Rathayibacter sp. AY1E8]